MLEQTSYYITSTEPIGRIGITGTGEVLEQTSYYITTIWTIVDKQPISR